MHSVFFISSRSVSEISGRRDCLKCVQRVSVAGFPLRFRYTQDAVIMIVAAPREDVEHAVGEVPAVNMYHVVDLENFELHSSEALLMFHLTPR